MVARYAAWEDANDIATLGTIVVLATLLVDLVVLASTDVAASLLFLGGGVWNLVVLSVVILRQCVLRRHRQRQHVQQRIAALEAALRPWDLYDPYAVPILEPDEAPHSLFDSIIYER